MSHKDSELAMTQDPGPLLHALLDVLETESNLLENGSAEELHDIVERKDALTHKLGLHPALQRDASGALAQSMSADNVALIERCNSCNQENGARISQRRQLVQERLARLNRSGTYEASGTINTPKLGNWSASV